MSTMQTCYGFEHILTRSSQDRNLWESV